ncbi:MAG: hypothetical protein WCD70_07770 [Alphaproteobacteria bacterium]
MKPPLPLNAGEIYIKCRIEKGGIGAIAFTDEAGLPYIGLCPLNWEGQIIGLPCRFQRQRLMADVVVGFNGHKPIVVFMDAEITELGLSLRLCLSAESAHQHHFSVPWGSSPPSYRLTIFPANSNWIVAPSPQELPQQP